MSRSAQNDSLWNGQGGEQSAAAGSRSARQPDREDGSLLEARRGNSLAICPLCL
jgi:hypothetical protein